MDAERVARLTDGQRDCLRLVLIGLGSKEIGRRLGISPHTVDQRVRIACRLLGVDKRFEAARILAEYEHGSAYQQLVYQPSHIPEPAPPRSDAPTDQPDTEDRPEERIAVQEEQASFELTTPHAPPARPLPFPTRSRERNELKTMQRLAWIVGIAIGAALSFGMLLSGLDALSRALG